MNCIYILFKQGEQRYDAPFIVGVYEKEEDAYSRIEEMFNPNQYFVEEWEIQ